MPDTAPKEPKTEPRDLVYTPPEVGRYTLDEITARKDNKRRSVLLGLPSVDAKMTPLRPGQLVTILGRSSHYKSGLAQWWARRLAQETLEQEGQEVVVYGTCEMAIEELGLYDLAVQAKLDAGRVSRGEVTDEEIELLQGAAMKRGALPLWLLGHSLARRRKRIRVSIYTIEQALYWIEDNMDFKARIIFLDYLNLLDSQRGIGMAGERRIDITEIVHCAKDLALTMGCPVVMLAQAHRRCDDREWKLPGMRDAMESASIEQFSDKILSVWMPIVTDKGRSVPTPSGDVLNASTFEHLLILGLVKQKDGPAGGYFKLYIDPAHNQIAEMARQDPPPF